MAHVIGVGAVMIYAGDPAALSRWYGDVMGIETVFSKEGGCYYGAIRNPASDAETQFAVLLTPRQLAPGGRAVMVNYQVDDLGSFLERLGARGVEVEKLAENEYGKFAHIHDPEENPIEIWQAPSVRPRNV